MSKTQSYTASRRSRFSMIVGHRQARALEDPSATNFAWDALDGRAPGPIKRCRTNSFPTREMGLTSLRSRVTSPKPKGEGGPQHDRRNSSLSHRGPLLELRTCPSRAAIGHAIRGMSSWHFACLLLVMPVGRRFVYVLKTRGVKSAFYVGVTSDVRSRLAAHNAGECRHTAPCRPWDLHVAIEFRDEETAVRFERYLKTGSGRAFARHHFDCSEEDPTGRPVPLDQDTAER